jgi:hypothetical protein
MPLYTFILEYKDFTCIQQASGSSLGEALKDGPSYSALAIPPVFPGTGVRLLQL